ncbi:tetratricopeptide repeat protein [Pyxidicoccus fallax]|uniref:Tetratricopeptide repeat protein n=1 Tax=Pyxidicoccus fallax TaxID=394095 RepID=A0A848LHA1_9BACT|nr:tetratricopeptide repeat protein [Pyxidicoccus fallax]NMO17095.1 tetratricopeptide repeat protein [Pyxidicoccus fallax]NPC78840.1 tetratricopeptide repeat protein [Pyxidicoccus fallax]
MRSSTRSPRRSGVVLAVVGALLLAPVSGRAEASPDAETQARARFAEGNLAYDVGDFDKALKSFSEAYRLKPLPGFLFNMAQCHRQLGQYPRAAFFYRRYLALMPDSAQAQVVRELVQEMEARAREQEARRLERERAEQDKQVQRARAEAAKAEAEAAARRRAELEAEQRALEARAAQALTQPAPQALAGNSVSAPWTRKWWVWAGVGAAAALVTTGVIVATSGPDARPTSLGTLGPAR